MLKGTFLCKNDFWLLYSLGYRSEEVWWEFSRHCRFQSQIAKFMGLTWGPPGSYRPQMGPMLAQGILLSGITLCLVKVCNLSIFVQIFRFRQTISGRLLITLTLHAETFCKQVKDNVCFHNFSFCGFICVRNEVLVHFGHWLGMVVPMTLVQPANNCNFKIKEQNGYVFNATVYHNLADWGDLYFAVIMRRISYLNSSWHKV